MNNPFSLKDKTILVTGASSGIGKAVAIECSKLGASLIITARNKQRLTETYDLLYGENHQIVIADLSNQTGINYLASNLPNLNGIVHSSGIVKPKPFAFLNRMELEEIIETNFFGPALLTNDVLRRKILSKGASIVFISSISGVMCSYIGGSAYSASKGAINGLVKGMALDLSPKGIRVNSVLPGMIDTNIIKDGSITQEQLDQDKKRYPLGRYGLPEEVAYAVIFLLSDASAWMTGSNILLDGGYTLI
jgi:NAD(P)-dependent dehydrogenase (short-subunit alcohol dehydrogenase family)